MRHIIIIILLVLAVNATVAQSSQDDLRLAYSYYNSKEYDKAAYLFDNLFQQSRSRTYFTYYVNCLIKTQQYDKAEKAAKKQASGSKSDPCYRVILGYIYKQQNLTDKAQAEYDAVVEGIRPERNQIIQITNQFLSLGENEYAEKTLLKGRDITGDNFDDELFSVYSSSRNFKMMSETGLNMILRDHGKIFTVQNMFQYYINNDINDEFYNILRTSLLERIQKNPSTQYSEMMIWLFVQKKNFRSAIVQAKALDKRLGESGLRLINIADQALAAKDYPAASEAYKYVLTKGKDNDHYQRASFGVLTAMYEQVKEGSISDSSQLLFLERQYAETFSEFGYTSKTIPEIINYSSLETYHLNKPGQAQEIVEKALESNSLNYSQKAQLNLELGDIMLYQGNEWDALMTYAKVENDNKQNEYGDEAKFRKARVAYYTGNFKWAASQLDVLKAATTKLVANDAMELSLILSDNTDDEQLGIFARADMLSHQNQHQRAIMALDTIINDFKTSPLVDDALYMKAKIYYRKHQYDSAATYYKRVADDYSYDILADKACYHYAKIAENFLKDKDEAKKYYMRILADYPGSVFAVEARERYREISGE